MMWLTPRHMTGAFNRHFNVTLTGPHHGIQACSAQKYVGHRRIYAEGSAKTGVGIEEAFSKLLLPWLMRRTRMRCGGRIQGEGKGGRQEERG